ncbi:MAG: alpha-L-fucosidase [Verrucomicrobiota bacterium]
MKKNRWIFTIALIAGFCFSAGIRCRGQEIPSGLISFEEEKRLQEKYVGFQRVDPGYVHAGEAALERWMDWKYGLRIHWGLYTQFADKKPWSGASWLLKSYKNDKDFIMDYFTSYQRFNPTGFNADEWMEIMKRGGMKYFSFTTKHHDGFCFWPTKTLQKGFYKKPDGTIEEVTNHFSMMETPYKHDIVGELVKSGRAHGLGVSLYYSHIDWHDYDFGWDPINYWYDPAFTRTSDPARWAAFIQKEKDQVTELLSSYGPIDTVCFDMSWGQSKKGNEKEEKAFDIAKLSRQLQPNALLRNRGTEMYGDYETPEGEIPDDPNVMARPWQVIYPCGTSMSFRANDTYKPKEWLLESLVDIVAKGGNFQVGFGPDAEGRWPKEMIERVNYVGDWLKVNEECIFASRPYLRYHEGPAVRFTRTKDKKYVYLICLKWPGEKLQSRMVKPVEGSAIQMLGVKQNLTWRQEGDTLTVDLPAELQNESSRPCPQAFVFKIESKPWETFANTLPHLDPLPSANPKKKDANVQKEKEEALQKHEEPVKVKTP